LYSDTCAKCSSSECDSIPMTRTWRFDACSGTDATQVTCLLVMYKPNLGNATTSLDFISKQQMGILSTCVTFTDSWEMNKQPICAQVQCSHNVTNICKCQMSKIHQCHHSVWIRLPHHDLCCFAVHKVQQALNHNTFPYFHAAYSTHHTVQHIACTQAASPRWSLVTATHLSRSHSMQMHTTFRSSRLVINLAQMAGRPTLYVRCRWQGICFDRYSIISMSVQKTCS
jgi:hypothetical protein